MATVKPKKPKRTKLRKVNSVNANAGPSCPVKTYTDGSKRFMTLYEGGCRIGAVRYKKA
tara:strand:+ start:2111 stop:2287 length:177 start_codon:yes stop_codon:yes gene_type:complete